MEIKNKRWVVKVVDPAVHAEAKAQAARRGITLNEYIVGSVLEQIKKDKKYE